MGLRQLLHKIDGLGKLVTRRPLSFLMGLKGLFFEQIYNLSDNEYVFEQLMHRMFSCKEGPPYCSVAFVTNVRTSLGRQCWRVRLARGVQRTFLRL
jgi:hypothetical protein